MKIIINFCICNFMILVLEFYSRVLISSTAQDCCETGGPLGFNLRRRGVRAALPPAPAMGIRPESGERPNNSDVKLCH